MSACRHKILEFTICQREFFYMSTSLGARLKEYRLAKGLKLAEMAKKISISHGSLSGLENNKSKPSADTLKSLCLHTDIDIEWLLTGEKKNGSITAVHPELLAIARWLAELIEKEPYREDWFKAQFEDFFPNYKEWKLHKKS